MKNRIWFFAGGSGGHIIPLITLLKKMNREKQNQAVFWTDTFSLTLSIMKKEKDDGVIRHHEELFYPKPSRAYYSIPFIFFTFFYFFRFLYGLIKNLPSDIYLTGGYIGIPVSLAAFFLNFFLSQKIVIHLYHLDVVPGKAARLISCFDPCQYILYQKTKEYLYRTSHIIKTTYPVRYTKADIIDKNEAKGFLGIPLEKPVILILGGSQGSQELNELVRSLISTFLSGDCFIVHQAGIHSVEEVSKVYQEAGILALVFHFRKDLNLFFSAADGVISRAGAGTIAEITFFKKKAILIPLKGVAHDHQFLNAQEARRKNPLIHIVSTIGECKIHVSSWYLAFYALKNMKKRIDDL
jgi:UDP-N-acetylglucosamine:LPS N-acetylglucosamine transferase